MSEPPQANGPTEFVPLVYQELRRLAAGYMRRERPDHTLEPTVLVNEAYLRLAGNTRLEWQGKTHFLAMAAIEMRRVLVDHARKRKTEKMGGGWKRVSLAEDVAVTPGRKVDVLALDEALLKLAAFDFRQSRVAELRLFGGLTERESAESLGVSERTVREDWRVARAWLARELSK